MGLRALLLLVAALGASEIQAVSERLELAPAGGRSEPQVATLCEPGDAYLAQHMGEQGRWISSGDTKSCMTDKLEILQYCKKAYPKRDITNIVESSHYVRVNGWCKPGKSKCKLSRWVKPYRCLEGPFQSDALLVPEGCLFDHLHNQTKCWESYRWNSTAADTCRERNMNLRSFAMLLPCGISLFAGVEFVCCPKHLKENMKLKKHFEMHVPKGVEDDFEEEEEEEEEEDAAVADEADQDDEAEDDSDSYENLDDVLGDQLDDDESNEEYFEDYDGTARPPSSVTTSTSTTTTSTTTTTTTSTTTAAPEKIKELPSTNSNAVGGGGSSSTPTSTSGSQQQLPGAVFVPHGTSDPYLTHFDPRSEHQSYKQAQMRLEEIHKEEVTKVMKDWSDLEERYQDIRARDPVAADAFKRWMTVRFQQTVAALEASGAAEKHHLSAMHQQRVQETVKQRNEEAMTCYTAALNEIPPNEHRIQKCLQKLLRALHKDRHHTIAHYKHLLDSSLEQAQREKSATLEHLADIDRITNQSLLMLERYPELSSKIGKLMDDYVLALRSKDETPGLLLAMTREAEAAILDKFQADVASKQQEKEHQKQLERERKEQRKAERGELRSEQEQLKTGDEQQATSSASLVQVEKKDSAAVAAASLAAKQKKEQEQKHEQHEQLQQQQPVVAASTALKHNEALIQASHRMAHDVSHSEPSYSVRREVYRKENRSVYFTLAFAGVALMTATIIGVAMFKRYSSSRSPHSQGFMEVDQAATPEERHVANMQVNGYENPTYKYFEVKE
ncbi:amyloid-beta-like protein [Copidosoma floridanum]|uniref:amyloid-beta-like protein n=1 Tax=Copidosoma floridanum TaxID=29053 RepID=UPI0006C99A08|nr:amyloid-beta-like protein [Copidosoma floridanum]XP_014206197.1 amyloid-beta-like protein [Copidosoma floridanum]